MVFPGVRCELVELVKYEDRKEEVLGGNIPDFYKDKDKDPVQLWVSLTKNSNEIPNM